jgi:hypothetical protein
MRAAIMIAVAIAAAGCASPYPLTWDRERAGPDELRMEAAQCRVQAMTGSNHPDAVVAYVGATSIYRDCMIGKGWRRTAEKAKP